MCAPVCECECPTGTVVGILGSECTDRNEQTSSVISSPCTFQLANRARHPWQSSRAEARKLEAFSSTIRKSWSERSASTQRLTLVYLVLDNVLSSSDS